MKVKVWMRSMEITPVVYGPNEVKLTIETTVNRNDAATLEAPLKDVNDLDLRFRAGRPVFLVSEDELGSSREIASLKAQLEIALKERDAALQRVVNLKTVAKSLLDRL